MSKILKTDKGLVSVQQVGEPTVVIEQKNYHHYLVNARWMREPQAAFNVKELYDFNTFVIKALSFPSQVSLKKFAVSKGAGTDQLTITSITEVPKGWNDEE